MNPPRLARSWLSGTNAKRIGRTQPFLVFVLRHVDDVNLINDRAPLVFADVMRVALQTTHLQTMRRGSTGRLPTTSLLQLPPLYSVVSALEVVVILAGPVQP